MDWIVKLFDGHLSPRAQEYDVAHQNFIFERSPEGPCAPTRGLLHLSANSTHCLEGRSYELADFQLAAEHASNKRCVFVDFVRCPRQLQFLDDLEGLIKL